MALDRGMPAAELFEAGKLLFGKDASITVFAGFLGRDRMTTWHWLNGSAPIPPEVAAEVRRAVNRRMEEIFR